MAQRVGGWGSLGRRFARGRQWPTIVLETALGLAGLALASALIPLSWGFLEIQPHPFWAVVLLQAARYGSGPGFLAAVAAGALLALMAVAAPVGTYLDWELVAAQPLLFILVATAIGEVREAQRNREAALTARNVELSDALRDLAQRYLSATELTAELERRIVGQTSTVLTLHEAARRLDTLDPAEVYPAVLDLLGAFLQVEEASIYLLQQERLQPMAHLPAGSPAPDPALVGGEAGLW